MALSTFELSFLVFEASLLLFSVSNNFCVIAIIMRNKKLRNVTNILICNLAVSDIILGGVVLPQNLHDLSHEENFHEGSVLCKTAFGLLALCITSSIATLVFISYERKRSIVNSLQSQMTLHTCKKVIPAIWAFAILTTMPTMIEYSVDEVTYGNVTYISCGSHVSPLFSILNGCFLLTISYIVPLFLMTFNYVQIILFVLRKSRSVDVQLSSPKQSSLKQKRQQTSSHAGNSKGQGEIITLEERPSNVECILDEETSFNLSSSSSSKLPKIDSVHHTTNRTRRDIDTQMSNRSKGAQKLKWVQNEDKSTTVSDNKILSSGTNGTQNTKRTTFESEINNRFNASHDHLEKLKNTKTTQHDSPSGITTNKNSFLYKNRIRIVQMLITVALLFAVSWLPYFVSQMITKIKGEDSSENISSFLNLLKLFLASFSTGYNVIIYVIFNSQFRKELKKLLPWTRRSNHDGE